MKDQSIEGIRHSLAHLLAQTVKELFPGSQNAIGPIIENGFYQDFEIKGKISEDDLPKIEEAMRAKLKAWTDVKKQEVSLAEAKEIFADNKYKIELAEEFAEGGKPLTVYTMGGFDDLCKGGHADNLSLIDPASFHLTKTAGAYWRGDEKNIMLTRIYGVAFETKLKLDECLKQQEMAKERDHRKLGKELDLFTFSDLVGPGLPLFTPRGATLRRLLIELMRQVGARNGSQEVQIPHLARKELYEISGHAQKFSGELFNVESHYDIDFVMKPVNCPHHIQIYKSNPRSYKDLPIHYSEVTMQYRDEKPGQIGGLQRVRAISVDDGHIFLAPENIEQVIDSFLNIIKEVHTALGIYGDHWVSLSLRDPNKPEAYIGDDKDWQVAESTLREIAAKRNLNAIPMEGEAALYGPKLDFMYKTVTGQETQLATIQLDFATPKRFEMVYIDKNGQQQTPIMVHRAILGSLERFLVMLIEKTAGHFPFWLAPEQIRIVTVNDKVNDYVKRVQDVLSNVVLMQPLKFNELRFSADLRKENLGKKIKSAEELKIPVIIIVGPKDEEAQTVSLRYFDGAETKEDKIPLTELANWMLKFNG
ncbi:MAG: threonine--tRNA ligase [Candidatus Saccharimonadales bacterium]